MKTRKVYVLNPSQSKRLIAKGVCALPQIQAALESGKIFVARGSTNAYVLDELYQQAGIEEKFNLADYTMGQVIPGTKFMNWTTNKGKIYPEIILNMGKKEECMDRGKQLQKFEQNDIVIKGGNALDPNGIPAVLIGSPKDGGTIGSIQSIVQAKGLELVCPIGLEKLIFSEISELQHLMGIENCEHTSEGFKCGIIPMPYATVITELEALEVLFDCEAYHVSSGGVGGAEGSIAILIEGMDEEEMLEIDKFMQKISAEPVYRPNQ
jgi:hypothetical protein